MGDSNIEWTSKTWNPIAGCSVLSPGCTKCYAMKMAARLEAMGVDHYKGLTKKVNGSAVWTGKISKAPISIFDAPLRVKKPTTWFVNSMSDLFHEDVSDEIILDVLTIMAISGHHTFQLLTKRAERMRDFMSRPYLLDDIYTNWYTFSGSAPEVQSWPLHNLWLGVSAEDQRRYDERKYALRDTPAAVRFFSMEPLLGPIVADFLGSWVIVGGESGPGARAMRVEWARSIVRQCVAAGVPVFMKQFGSNPREAGDLIGDTGFIAVPKVNLRDRKGGDPEEWPEDLRIRQMPGAA